MTSGALIMELLLPLLGGGLFTPMNIKALWVSIQKAKQLTPQSEKTFIHAIAPSANVLTFSLKGV